MTSGGGTTTTTAYYGGLALSVNGAPSYTLADGLGSVSASVTASGSNAGQISATQLYGPYGRVRYQNGTLPTSKGYTGQRSDASTSGLDYYNARSYDPVAGQFTSADPLTSVGIYALVYSGHLSPGQSTPDSNAQRQTPPRDSLNAYIYVKGNPETSTDPTGLWSFGICVSVGVGAGIGGSLAGCAVVAVSDDGQWTGGLTGTAGGGVSVGEEAIGGVGIQVTNAQHVSDLSGPFNFAGGTVADIVGGGVTGFSGQDSHGRTVGGADVQAVLGEGVSGHGGTSNTGVLEFTFPPRALTAQEWHRAIYGPAGPASGPSLQAWNTITQGLDRLYRPATQIFNRVQDGWGQLKESYVHDAQQTWSRIVPWWPPTRWLH